MAIGYNAMLVYKAGWVEDRTRRHANIDIVGIKRTPCKGVVSFLNVRAAHAEAANKWLKLPPPPVVVQQSAWPFAKGFIYHTFPSLFPLYILIQRVIFVVSSCI